LAPLIIAHRGAMTEAPENTRPAFDKAVSYAVDGIEFDVQITKDGCPVIFHDTTLAKFNEKLKSISDFTFQDLSAYDWGKWFSEAFKNEKILTLDQVLKSYGHKTRLMIEIKPSPKEETKNLYYKLAAMVVESIRKRIPVDQISKMYVLSFDPEIIKSAYLNDPDLNYVLNINAPQIDHGHVNIDPELLCGYCIEHTQLSRQFVEHVHHYDKMIMTYSCNSEETLRHLLDLDLDVIMTDDPGHPMWQGKFVLTAKPINHGPVDALTVGTVADPTMRVAVGRATVPASQIE
jgi:glycerophosphoryl diester phosphodiesterase